MVAVRRKLAFSRTATIPKDNRYEHGPAQAGGKCEYRARGAGVRSAKPRAGLIKYGCASPGMKVYFAMISYLAIIVTFS